MDDQSNNAGKYQITYYPKSKNNRISDRQS